jgi:hypothetical protein
MAFVSAQLKLFWFTIWFLWKLYIEHAKKFIVNIYSIIMDICIKKYIKRNVRGIKHPLQEITVYLTRKLNQKPVILTFGQFDHLIIFGKSIWTHPIWLMVFFIDHKMVFSTSQIEQIFGQPKKNLKNSWICKYINVNIVNK